MLVIGKNNKTSGKKKYTINEKKGISAFKSCVFKISNFSALKFTENCVFLVSGNNIQIELNKRQLSKHEDMQK